MRAAMARSVIKEAWAKRDMGSLSCNNSLNTPASVQARPVACAVHGQQVL